MMGHMCRALISILLYVFMVDIDVAGICRAVGLNQNNLPGTIAALKFDSNLKSLLRKHVVVKIRGVVR